MCVYSCGGTGRALKNWGLWQKIRKNFNAITSIIEILPMDFGIYIYKIIKEMVYKNKNNKCFERVIWNFGSWHWI